MRNSMFRFLAVATALALAPALASAKGPKGNPHSGGANFSDHDRDDREHHAKGHGDHDRDDDRDGDHDRDDRGRPPGWSKGKKTGWGNCDVPPGQVKKLGCHPRNATARRHGDGDHDRDDRNRPTATVPPRPVRSTTPIPVQRRQQAAARTTTTTTRRNVRRTGSKAPVLDQGAKEQR
jgi:hypothetical protein